MNRKFGIELEIAGITKAQALNALQAVDINVQSEGYNHETRNYWKLVSDSSVSGGFEVVSPILEGEAGISEAEIVARALDDMGANVNGTCGFHVHINARDLTAEQVKAIVLRYAKHEDEIDAFMPKSRRGNQNYYCKSVKSYIHDNNFLNAHTINGLANAMGSRYYKVNLQAHYRQGSIEFRQHSGTINAAKIANWVRFLDGFMNETLALMEAAPAESIAPLTGIHAKVAAYLEEEVTVTMSKLMERFNWLHHTGRSVISRMRKMGLGIERTKVNGELAYRINRNARTDSLWNGITNDVANFYQRRAKVLALAA